MIRGLEHLPCEDTELGLSACRREGFKVLSNPNISVTLREVSSKYSKYDEKKEKDTQVCQPATEFSSAVQNIFTFKNQLSQNNLCSLFLMYFLANIESNHV